MRKKVLLIRLSSIGDIVLTTPVIQALRRYFPNDTIDFLVDKRFRDILENNPNLNNVISYDKSKSKKEITTQRNNIILEGKYDYIFDLHNNFRSRHFSKGLSDNIFRIKKRRLHKLSLIYFKHSIVKIINVVDNYYKTLDKLNIPKIDEGLQIFTGDIQIESIINFDSEKKYLAVAPGAAHFTKRMPTEKFIELLNMFSNSKSAEIILLGGKDDIDICREIQSKAVVKVYNLAGQLSIRESAAVIKKCSALITNDTAIMHLGAAVKVPIAAIFGTTVKDFGFTPYKSDYKVFETNDKCRPCTHIGRKSCPKKHFNCMKNINTAQIFDWLKEKINI